MFIAFLQFAKPNMFFQKTARLYRLKINDKNCIEGCLVSSLKNNIKNMCLKEKGLSDFLIA